MFESFRKDFEGAQAGGTGAGEIVVEADGAAQMVEVECSFYFVAADFLRANDCSVPLPAFQELQRTFPDHVTKKKFSFAQVASGTHTKDVLTVSHRWLTRERPDPDAVQLQTIKKYLTVNPHIQWVWFDEWCMPQGKNKTAEESASFKEMLTNVNVLYLSTQVLILLDISYTSRFWTQFEAWLSMQKPEPGGLRPAQGTEARFHIECIQNAVEQAEQYESILIETWAKKTPAEAHDFLAKPDVTVTNTSDKIDQLEKIKQLNDAVRRAFKILEER
eukprot:3821920-Prymnesium_polylepis.1